MLHDQCNRNDSQTYYSYELFFSESEDYSETDLIWFSKKIFL